VNRKIKEAYNNPALIPAKIANPANGKVLKSS
jgi:hypothetical protein